MNILNLNKVVFIQGQPPQYVNKVNWYKNPFKVHSPINRRRDTVDCALDSRCYYERILIAFIIIKHNSENIFSTTTTTIIIDYNDHTFTRKYELPTRRKLLLSVFLVRWYESCYHYPRML